jgi:hypothetical protein
MPWRGIEPQTSQRIPVVLIQHNDFTTNQPGQTLSLGISFLLELVNLTT